MWVYKPKQKSPILKTFLKKVLSSLVRLFQVLQGVKTYSNFTCRAYQRYLRTGFEFGTPSIQIDIKNKTSYFEGSNSHYDLPSRAKKHHF